MFRCCLVFSAFLMMLMTMQANAQSPVVYAVTSVNWEPYWIVSEQGSSGILNDVMIELDRRSPHFFFASPNLSVRRSRQAFHDGDAILECCVSEDWRAQHDVAGKTLWTDTVMLVKERLIYPKNAAFPANELKDLKGKSIATILGYGYAGDKYFNRFDTIDNIAQMGMIAKKRTDAAIIDAYEYDFMLKHSEEIQKISHQLEVGPIIHQSDLKMRIHSSRPDLLEPINRAINAMKEDGTIQKLIRRYTE